MTNILGMGNLITREDNVRGKISDEKSRSKLLNRVAAAVMLISLALKLAIIFRYGNRLSLNSDDLNYIKSAKVLLESGRFIFQQYNEPTVFVMPLYPAFLAGVFGVFGSGFTGLQAARIIQALMGTASLLLIFMSAGKLFGDAVALLSATFAAFYMPNLVTPGYMLTETLFTLLLLLLLYLSIIFTRKTSIKGMLAIGVVYTAACLCRPTIAPYPAVLAAYMLLFRKIPFKAVLKSMAVIAIVFVLIMSPWWIRNYREYGEFIALAASGGNPMLQGTYIDYRQTPENVTHYTAADTAFETNKIETRIAIERIKQGFKEDFKGYLKWYTLGKTKYFWLTTFYWKQFARVPANAVIISHYVILTGFAGMLILLIERHKELWLPLLMMLYFNFAHCVYMAFDRYAYPIINILVIFTAYFFIRLLDTVMQAINMKGNLKIN